MQFLESVFKKIVCHECTNCNPETSGQINIRAFVAKKIFSAI
jgi:hypothetical protein